MDAIAFHLAAPIRDIEETRTFYQSLLGCRAGREAENWIDFDFFGHQVSFHVRPDEAAPNTSSSTSSGNPSGPVNEVDGKSVPVRHFGAILEWQDWQQLAKKLKREGAEFIIEPYIRFKGEIGEQATMFFLDPSGNALEFKAFRDPAYIFAH